MCICEEVRERLQAAMRPARKRKIHPALQLVNVLFRVSLGGPPAHMTEWLVEIAWWTKGGWPSRLVMQLNGKNASRINAGELWDKARVLLPA